MSLVNGGFCRRKEVGRRRFRRRGEGLYLHPFSLSFQAYGEALALTLPYSRPPQRDTFLMNRTEPSLRASVNVMYARGSVCMLDFSESFFTKTTFPLLITCKMFCLS